MIFKDLCEQLEESIINSYTQGVTLDEAEKLAGKFLYAQMIVSKELQKVDLDARMKKSGTKAVRAAVYMDAATKSDKKPTESALEHTINMNKMVSDEQNRFDDAESTRDDLERYYNIFRDAHVYFRQLSKGKFE